MCICSVRTASVGLEEGFHCVECKRSILQILWTKLRMHVQLSRTVYTASFATKKWLRAFSQRKAPLHCYRVMSLQRYRAQASKAAGTL